MRKYHRSLLWLKLLLTIIKVSLKEQPFGTSALKTLSSVPAIPSYQEPNPSIKVPKYQTQVANTATKI